MYLIFCGGKETMQRYADSGVRGLNSKTHRWQIIDKTAMYNVLPAKSSKILWELYCNKDLFAIAKEKGLII